MADRIDEIMGTGGFEDPDIPPRPPKKLGQRINWQAPQAGLNIPIQHKQQSPDRFSMKRPELPKMDFAPDLDALLAQIKAEEALPPHKKNQAKISQLKQQAREMFKRNESDWVEMNADLLLPRIDENQDY